MIEAVLFDLGDTLVHFETSEPGRFLEAGTRPAYERLCELGVQTPPYERYVRAIKRRFLSAYVWSRIRRREVQIVDSFRRLHARMGIHLGEELITDLTSRCIAAMRPFFSTDAEAVPVVRELHLAGFKLGLVSNTFFPGDGIDDVLRHEGLLDYFPVRAYSSEVRYMKPHRKIFRVALDELGVAADKTIHVGDRMDKDVWGSTRLGITSVLVCRNGHVPRGRVRPDHVINKLTELPPLLQV